MGLLGKIIAAKVTAKLVEGMNRKARATPATPASRQEYIPANAPATRSGLGGLASRCGQFCRDNPKLMGSLGIAVAALALQQLTRRRA